MAGRAVAFALLFAVLLYPAGAADVDGQKCPTEHIRYIRCQVCELIVKEISEQVANKREEKLRKYDGVYKENFVIGLALKLRFWWGLLTKKVDGVSKHEIQTIIKKVCSPEKQEEHWISRIDISQKGEKLELVDKEKVGYCDEKCKIIQCACQEVMHPKNYNGYKAVAQFVYDDMTESSVQKKHLSKQLSTRLKEKLCEQLSEACAKDPPPVPEDLDLREPFARMLEGIPGASSMENNFGDRNDEDNFVHEGGKVPKDTDNKCEWGESKTEL